ncbi:MAG: excisionase [Peptococcaceae bacterium]|jgi:hypothetical protein|nr:excisionase [Peptococcaceae bacterium]
MHRNTAVAELTIDETVAAVTGIGDVFRPEHIPVGIPVSGGRPDRKALHDWWIGRAIPASRSGLREALEILRVSSPQFLLTRCYGLSLSDQYWLKPADKPIGWADVNFFDNPFSEDVGNALFGRAPEDAELNLMSPDNTSDGWLKKKWIIADGKRLLLKGGSPPNYQEPLNEVIASAVMRRLGIPHTPYALTWDREQPLSACEDFVTKETDLVSAWHIRVTGNKAGHVSEYRHFLERREALGIPGARESAGRMLTVDFLIANQDRHFNNFGALRDAGTLEWLGLAPVFDCGTSLWYDQNPHMIRPLAEQASKPFRSKHSEQIKLVTDFDWLDFGALDGLDEEYAGILEQSPYIDGARRDALCFALKTRVELLKDIAAEPQPE